MPNITASTSPTLFIARSPAAVSFTLPKSIERQNTCNDTISDVQTLLLLKRRFSIKKMALFGKSSKADYEATAEAKMQKLGAQIDELQAKANLAKADAKVKYQEQIDVLKVKQSEAQVRYEKLKASADDAWEEMKSGVDSAWQELQVAFDKAKSKLDA